PARRPRRPDGRYVRAQVNVYADATPASPVTVVTRPHPEPYQRRSTSFNAWPPCVAAGRAEAELSRPRARPPCNLTPRRSTVTNAPVSPPDLYPSPESLPPSLWPHLVELLRGQLPESREAAHYAWHAAGYGLFCWAGQEPPVMLAGETLTAAQAAD